METVPRTNAAAKMCVGKSRYKTTEEADRSIRKILLSKNPPKFLRSYLCPICNWLHLTKRER